MGSDSEPVVEDVSADDAKAAMQRQATQQAQVKSIINSIDIEALKRAKIAKALEMQKEADKLPSLTPEVKWAQNPEALSITISLSQVMKPEIKINGNTLEFCASGVGATGQRRNYEFELDFFDHVDRGFMARGSPQGIQLIVRKDRETCYMWKQLTKGPKPGFLKIDTERWIDPDDIQFRSPEEMEKIRLQQLSQQERMMEEQYKQILGDEDNKFKAAEENAEFTKRCYLFAYSLSMFAGYGFVTIKLLYGIIAYGQEYLTSAYAPASRTINALQAFAFLETVHCYFGFTGGKVFTNFIQAFGRALILVYLSLNSRAQNSEFVFLLFASWCFADIIRYPYYLFTLMRKRMPRLEWLRYSAFVLLYPLGCAGEIGVIEATIKHMTEPLVTIIEPEPWEGSGEPPEDWSPGEPEVITTEQTPNPHIIQALRVHQCILPIAVLALMWMLFKSRAKALKVGAEIDAAIDKEKAEMDARMAAIQQKFMKMQKDQLAKQKTSEEKKDE